MKKKILIAEKNNEEIFEDMWRKSDLDLPDIPNVEDMILDELRAVRYGTSG
ncbi:MAG: hypothetical protein K9H64_02900 [Bacteroidales bacterium]|nr:hypothetical protein [Bacteroidales bacterium]MCF8454510.1 hypothetical protein [Bacteroidales bacterium]